MATSRCGHSERKTSDVAGHHRRQRAVARRRAERYNPRMTAPLSRRDSPPGGRQRGSRGVDDDPLVANGGVGSSDRRGGAGWLVRSADALGAADAGRERPRTFRSGILARLLQAASRRRRHAQRRRHRRLLPHRGPAPPSERSGSATAIRLATLVRGCRALGHARRRANRPACRVATTCRPRIRTGSPSDRRRRSRRRHWANPDRCG